MKIFKHRGDIYISKSGYKSSREERILLVILAVIVAFTVALVIFLGQKYHSFSQFIAGDEVTVQSTEITEGDDMLSLPSISGKTNYLVFETDEEQSSIHYAYILQLDADSLAYKVCSLSPDMVIDGKSLYDIYSTGGGAAVMSRLTAHLGFDIDYYVSFDKNSFVEYVNKYGTFIYPCATEIDYDGGSGEDTYSVRLHAGEQTLQGIDIANLLRYFTSDTDKYGNANEIILYAYTNLFNADNYENSEYLFRNLVSASSTNITVRDFENNKNTLYVFCRKNTDVAVYSCVARYEKKQLTRDCIQDMKGYFSK